MSYAREIKMPATKKDGLCNFVQMIINRIEAGEHREALLVAVDLLDTISGDTNPYAEITGDAAPAMMPMSEHFDALQAAKKTEFGKGFEAGQKAKASEYRKLIGEAA